jgi:hypothetical protein
MTAPTPVVDPTYTAAQHLGQAALDYAAASGWAKVVVIPPIPPTPPVVTPPPPGAKTHLGRVVLNGPGPYTIPAGTTFLNGLELGQFGGGPPIDVFFEDGVDVQNTLGGPIGTPANRALHVHGNATLRGAHTKIHHSMGDALGGEGTVVLTDVWVYDAFGPSSIAGEHVDCWQAMGGDWTLTRASFGLAPDGTIMPQGNVIIGDHHGPTKVTLTDIVIAGHRGRIPLDVGSGDPARIVTGSIAGVKVLMAGSTNRTIRIAHTVTESGISVV